MIEKLVKQHNNVLNSYWNQANTNFECLKDEDIEEQAVLFEKTYKKMIACEEYLAKYLLEKADITIYSCDFYYIRKKLL